MSPSNLFSELGKKSVPKTVSDKDLIDAIRKGKAAKKERTGVVSPTSPTYTPPPKPAPRKKAAKRKKAKKTYGGIETSTNKMLQGLEDL